MVVNQKPFEWHITFPCSICESILTAYQDDINIGSIGNYVECCFCGTRQYITNIPIGTIAVVRHRIKKQQDKETLTIEE